MWQQQVLLLQADQDQDAGEEVGGVVVTRLTCSGAGDVRPDHVLLRAGHRRRGSHPHHSQEHHRQHRLQLQLLCPRHVQHAERNSGA